MINQENYEEALNQLAKIGSFNKLDANNHLKILFNRIFCYINLGELAKAKETSEKLLNQSKKYKNALYEFDAILFLLKISMMLETTDETEKLIDEGEALLNQRLDNTSKEYKQRKATFLYLKATSFDPNAELEHQLPLIQESLSLGKEIEVKASISESLFGLGYYHLYKGNHDAAMKFFKESLTIGEEIGNRQLISQAYRALGNYYLFTGKFNLALDYTNKALTLAERIKNKCDISHNLLHLGEIYYYKGELEVAEKFITKSIDLAESIGYISSIILGFYDLGRLLQDRGEFHTSLECYKKALNIAKKRKAKFYLADGLYNLIRLYTYHLSPNQAIPLVKDLEQLKEHENSIWHDLIYRAGKALVLKTSKRLSDKMDALRIFQEIAEEPYIVYKITVEAIINLCELLLYELKTTGNEDILNELDRYCNQLLEIAQEQHSHSLSAQTYWLQSKLALLKLDIQQAQKLLLQAQAITDKKGLKTLANTIGYEHYSFFSQLQKWEEYIDKNVALSQRIELAQLENLVVKMIYKQVSEVPTKTIDELMRIEEFRTYLKEAKKILSQYEQ